MWRREKLARLRARSQGLPRGLLRPLSSRAAAVRSPCARPRRRPLCQALARARSRRSSHPRRGPEQLNAEQRRDLLEIVEDRYDTRSILITSQLPIERWYEIIGDPTLADAILDRIIHSAYRIALTGDSMRKLKAAAHLESEVSPPAKEATKSVSAPASKPAKAHWK